MDYNVSLTCCLSERSFFVSYAVCVGMSTVPIEPKHMQLCSQGLRAVESIHCTWIEAQSTELVENTEAKTPGSRMYAQEESLSKLTVGLRIWHNWRDSSLGDGQEYIVEVMLPT